ncbi:nicotinate-nucleotide adenylyltransferase [Lacticigenium naphthae]|uniref:nicotinate-nucleotide adenylyltransferase n=1 Tax=Lacticigenium naphthae TaxID=515351 RepID=UPI0003FC31CD|nr:nicotinate-nucleotide adenylyltransferase [Lacticigenium naphthae]
MTVLEHKNNSSVSTQSSPRVKEAHVKKKIGIFGGSFNPPHIGHLIIADQVQNQLGLEKILFIPTANPPHVSKKETISAEHRIEMITLSIEENPNFSVDLSEIVRGGKSYTFDTIVELKERNPETEYYFIIGGDMVADLKNWYKIEELLKIVQFVAVRRPHYAKETEYPVIWVDIPEIEISSTLIRQKIRQNCSVNYLISSTVLEYIQKEGLYKSNE